MKVTKDLLNALNVESVYIKGMVGFFPCMPVEMRPDGWTVVSDDAFPEGEALLKIKYRGSFFPIMANISGTEERDGIFFMNICFPPEEKLKDEFKKAFFTEQDRMIEKGETWNKRKEQRYTIGIDRNEIEKMQFKENEHVFIFEKRQMPCVVDNISYRGARVIMFDGSIKKDMKTYLILKYKNPIEQIGIMCITRNIQTKELQKGKKIQIVSLEYESVPLEYNYRMDAYIDRLAAGR